MRKNSGFTLIEALVSVALLTITAGLFLRLFLAGDRINAWSYEKNRAMGMAKEAVEIFKSCDLKKVLEQRKNGTTEIYGQIWEVTEEEGAYIFTRSVDMEKVLWTVEVKADYGVYQQEQKFQEEQERTEIFSDIPPKEGELPRLVETEEAFSRIFRLDVVVNKEEKGSKKKEELIRLISTKRE